MHDLRKQVLVESGKTVSRKAKSKVSSTAGSKNNSPAGSRVTSRVASRNPSDDESDDSDDTQQSINSIDDLPTEDMDVPASIWKQELLDRMGQITDRKRSSVQGREESLKAFAHILMAHYAAQDIKSNMSELITSILKSVKSGQSVNETVLALKALSVLVITEPLDDVYDAITGRVKLVITDSADSSAKVAAIRTLGVATFFGGASLDETHEVMDFLLDIISSDGHSIEAPDDGNVVTAALEEWGFLATQIEDMEDYSQEPMEAFVEQLESTNAGVQIAAGENIALLYEKSHRPLTHDEMLDKEDLDLNLVYMTKHYDVYRQEHQLVQLLEELSKSRSKRVSSKDKKSLRASFADVLNSVEHPGRGPRYSTSINRLTNSAYGSRLKVSLGGQSTVTINKWWKLFRLNALKRVLQGGFLVHYADNEVVFDALPIVLDG